MRLIIELEIEPGEDEDSIEDADIYRVVDKVLDNGTLQEAIEEYASDMDVGTLSVTSALVKPAPETEPTSDEAST